MKGAKLAPKADHCFSSYVAGGRLWQSFLKIVSLKCCVSLKSVPQPQAGRTKQRWYCLQTVKCFALGNSMKLAGWNDKAFQWLGLSLPSPRLWSKLAESVLKPSLMLSLQFFWCCFPSSLPYLHQKLLGSIAWKHTWDYGHKPVTCWQ